MVAPARAVIISIFEDIRWQVGVNSDTDPRVTEFVGLIIVDEI